MNHYNLNFIVLSMLLGYLSVMLTFGLISRLYKSPAIKRLSLFTYSTLIVGTSLWAIHVLNILAFPIIQSAGYTLSYLTLSWLTALACTFAGLYVASQKLLPIKALITGGFTSGFSACAIFYFSVTSMHVEPAISFSPLISLLAVMVSIAVATLSIMIMFWLKNYTGELPFITKSIFAVIISLAIIGAHLTNSAAIEVPLNAASSNSLLHFESTLLGVTVALGLICLFLVSFVVAIFYDKFGYHTFKFNLFKKEDAHVMSQLAMADALTQLPNRRALMQHLEAAIRRSDRNGTRLAVAFVDIDNFKQVNDSFGHHIGDKVLQRIAKKLVGAVRGCDEIARIGGDEFIALIEEIDSDEDCITIIKRMVSAANETSIINRSEIQLSASIGVAMYPKDGNIEQLITAADTAMYSAKKDGKNQFRFFDAEIAFASDQLIETQLDLRNAIANNELQLQYQIKIDSVTRAPVGAEALLRWQHPTRGLLLPHEFMQAAERFGLSYTISDWVIEESCRTLHHLKLLDIPFNIAINLSHHQILNVNIVHDIIAMLKRFDLPSSSLIIELTESVALKNKTLFNEQIVRFNEANIKVAIDDFGVQPSSLTSLQGWQIGELKLDPTFIADINNSNKTRGIIQSIIDLAHALELTVVAEGVETEAQRKTLSELGCDQMQGYLFSHPLPEARLIRLLENINQEKT